MCGIAGFWGAPDAALLATMTARIAHRGPDGEGFFEHPLASLGHRRLAIIDPAGGHQPVGTDDGLVQLTYNGEVYNFRELRAELEPLGHTFHTNCDTEVVLHAYLEWGTDCFARFNGMWALAILDLREGTPSGPRLVLARDHFGIKPLYYAALDRRTGAVRVGGQGRARRPRARDRARPAVALRLPVARAARPQAADGLHRDPRPGGGDVGGGRRRRRARADLLDADAHDRRRTRPGRVPRPLREVGRAAAGGRRPGGHLPLRWDRLVVDREGLGPVAPRARARRGVARRPPQDVLDRLRRRSHRRARVHGRGARRGRRRAHVAGADVAAVRRRDRPDGLAPGRADRLDRPVRAVVRDAARAAVRSRCCSTARAATSCSPATCPISTCTCASC